MSTDIHRQRKRAPMPWLLILIVLFTTAAAVAVPSDGERLVVLGIAEALIVAYFCVALHRLSKAAVRKAPHLDADGDQRPLHLLAGGRNTR